MGLWDGCWACTPAFIPKNLGRFGMTKKWLFPILVSMGMCSIAIGGDITDTGKSDKDVFTYYTNVKSLVNDLAMRAKTQCLSSSALTTNGTITKTGASASLALVNGSLVSIAASKDMPSLGTTALATATPYNIYIYTVNASGTFTTTAGTQAAGTNTITLPNIPELQAMIGFLVLYNGSNTSFLPGTHTLTAGSITATHYNTVGMVDFVPGSGSTNTLSLTGL